jgi:hypothetical protein
MSVVGPSHHFAAKQQLSRFWRKADIQNAAFHSPYTLISTSGIFGIAPASNAARSTSR